jgi:hypothetical protein
MVVRPSSRTAGPAWRLDYSTVRPTVLSTGALRTSLLSSRRGLGGCRRLASTRSAGERGDDLARCAGVGSEGQEKRYAPAEHDRFEDRIGAVVLPQVDMADAGT